METKTQLSQDQYQPTDRIWWQYNIVKSPDNTVWLIILQVIQQWQWENQGQILHSKTMPILHHHRHSMGYLLLVYWIQLYHAGEWLYIHSVACLESLPIGSKCKVLIVSGCFLGLMLNEQPLNTMTQPPIASATSQEHCFGKLSQCVRCDASLNDMQISRLNYSSQLTRLSDS